MLILGLVLIAVAAIAVLGAFFLLDGDAVAYFGADIPPLALFFIGAATVGVIWLGFVLTRLGTKRELRHRREQKKIDDLSAQLDRAQERKQDKDLDGDGRVG